MCYKKIVNHIIVSKKSNQKIMKRQYSKQTTIKLNLFGKETIQKRFMFLQLFIFFLLVNSFEISAGSHHIFLTQSSSMKHP